MAVIDERHVVADENLVLQRDSFTDEGMAGDFATVADFGAFLDLHKSPNFYVVPDLTTVQVGEAVNADIFAQLDVGGNLLKRRLR